MKIIIGSDICPTSSNIDYFTEGKIEKIVDKQILDIINKSDYRIYNFECSIGDENKLDKLVKCGPNLIAPFECINGLKQLNPSLILLANNHILDYGEEGMNNVINLLNKDSIAYTGIIPNAKEPLEKLIIEKENLKIGIYNLCENEFTVATNSEKGANGFQGLKNYNEIKELKKQCDYVLVVYHAGKEFYRYPSPQLQEICHNFVNYGADFVVTQHSHCIGCEEKYNGKSILYGQGNFIFDSADDEFWNSEILLQLDITKNKLEVNYDFIRKNKGQLQIDNSGKLRKEFEKRSIQIQNENFVESEYKKFALDSLNHYLFVIHRITFINRVFNKLFRKKFYRKLYSNDDKLALLNFIECEAHRELLIKGLKEDIKNNK